MHFWNTLSWKRYDFQRILQNCIKQGRFRYFSKNSLSQVFSRIKSHNFLEKTKIDLVYWVWSSRKAWLIIMISLFILLYYFPLFSGWKKKRGKNNQSRDFKSCLSARSLCIYFCNLEIYLSWAENICEKFLFKNLKTLKNFCWYLTKFSGNMTLLFEQQICLYTNNL